MTDKIKNTNAGKTNLTGCTLLELFSFYALLECSGNIKELRSV